MWGYAVVRNNIVAEVGHDIREIITAARSSLEPERGIELVLTSDRHVTPSFVEELQSLVREARGETIPVEVHVLRSAKAR